MNEFFKYFLIGSFFSITSTVIQAQVPSKILTDEKTGSYRKVTYEPQTVTYNETEYREAYLIHGIRFCFSPNGNTVITAPDGRTVFSENGEYVDGWSARPTFYFPKDKERPFIVSVTSGMETYWGSSLYVIDQDYTCRQIGFLSLAPMTGYYYAGEFDDVETVLKIKDQGQKGIRFSFAGDSVCYNLGTDDRFHGCTSTEELYFTYVGDTLLPSPNRNALPGVRRFELVNEIEEPYAGVGFTDANKDGHEDLYYVTHLDTSDSGRIQDEEDRRCRSRLILLLCRDGITEEKLTFELDYSAFPLYDRQSENILSLEEWGCGNNSRKAIHNYRLRGKELTEVMP